MTNDVQTAIRLPSKVLARVDALAARMSTEGIRTTRSGVLRMLVIQGLAKKSRPSAARRRRKN